VPVQEVKPSIYRTERTRASVGTWHGTNKTFRSSWPFGREAARLHACPRKRPPPSREGDESLAIGFRRAPRGGRDAAIVLRSDRARLARTWSCHRPVFGGEELWLARLSIWVPTPGSARRATGDVPGPGTARRAGRRPRAFPARPPDCGWEQVQPSELPPWGRGRRKKWVSGRGSLESDGQ
jgi:hypothetical protein